MFSVGIKAVFVGDLGIGKTALLLRYFDGEFPEHISTLLDFTNCQKMVGNEVIHYSLWEAVSSEENRDIRVMCYPDFDVILLFYSIDDINSFINLKKFYYKEAKEFAPSTPILLVATKHDLIEKSFTTNVDCISLEEGMLFAESIGAIDFLECSSLTGFNVDRIFERIKSIYEQSHDNNAKKVNWKIVKK
ncbi:Rac2g [Entamoeba marina]